MLKKLIVSSAVSLVLASSLFSKNITKEQCEKMQGDFIFAGNECIEYRSYEGDSNDHIIVIVHGTWDEGTNTLGRYAPFAESMNMNTDLTSIAIALPGYSKSSTNKLKSLASKEEKNLAAKKKYVDFLASLITKLKSDYKAKEVTLVGHSAGAMMAGTLSGLNPKLVNNYALVGGRYDIHKVSKQKDLISMIDVLDEVSKDDKFLFIYGTKDEISKPEVTTNFYKIAKQKGLNAKLIKVEGAGHIDLDMTDESVEAITSMIEEE